MQKRFKSIRQAVHHLLETSAGDGARASVPALIKSFGELDEGTQRHEKEALLHAAVELTELLLGTYGDFQEAVGAFGRLEKAAVSYASERWRPDREELFSTEAEVDALQLELKSVRRELLATRLLEVLMRNARRQP